MFAVIKTGGKQYKVAHHDELLVEKLDAEAGETVQFNEVLMLGGEGEPTVGAPRVDGAGVKAEVVEQTKGPKLISFKKRRRKHSSARRKGHRQQLTAIRVTGIAGAGGVAFTAPPAPAPEATPVEEAPAAPAADDTNSED
jgi:large subunit ribosomal protein L21